MIKTKHLNAIPWTERTKKIADERFKDIGFTIRKVGIGDGLQFSSLPENFFKKTGQKLIDISEPWYLDYNPYVIRSVKTNLCGVPISKKPTPKKTIELWNHPKIYDWPQIRHNVYLTNAEIHCGVMGIKDPVLIHPRLYRFEDFPFHKRETILFHPHGRSHGSLPEHVIEHILKKYNGTNFFQVGHEDDPSIGIQRINTPSLWELARVISECRMFIGIDSGPSWIAACYPDIVIKKIRTKFQYGYCEPSEWVPLDIKNIHSFWDCQSLFKIYNCFEEPAGFTESYRKI